MRQRLKEKNELAVNVYTEWAPLKEVVIGNCINFNMEGFDTIFRWLYRDNLQRIKKINPKIEKQYTVERQQDLDRFAALLQKRGIVVKRPKKLNEVVLTRTPHFKGLTNAVDDPRDMFLCLGDEIIETPPSNRNRYFEGLMLYHIFIDYFRRGAKWTLAPRSRLTADSLDKIHWREVKKFHDLKEIEERFDIIFDAANCLKFGRDILMNIGNKNSELGALWLQRHLGSQFRVHKTRICDWHIDGMLLPLRPGVLLINPMIRKRLHLLPKPLQKWKMLFVSMDRKAKAFDYPQDHLQLASSLGMNTNVLSLDEKTVCVRAKDKLVQDILRKEGFKVIPVQLRHCELFGGGLHCATLDVRRDETLKDYWS